jgi:hypothetical protein
MALQLLVLLLGYANVRMQTGVEWFNSLQLLHLTSGARPLLAQPHSFPSTPRLGLSQLLSYSPHTHSSVAHSSPRRRASLPFLSRCRRSTVARPPPWTARDGRPSPVGCIAPKTTSETAAVLSNTNTHPRSLTPTDHRDLHSR